VLLGVILGSLFMAFGGGRGRKSVRRIWQGLLVGVFGLGLGDLLSVSLLAGWSRHGVAWETAPGLVLLVALALLVPWATERAWYCHHLCPHGVLQEWLARIRRWQVAVPERLNRWLVWGGPVLLGLAFLFALARVDVDLARIEPFDAWTLTPAAWVSGIVALIGLAASLFVPMAYCRFGCPTGALLAFLRHAGRGDRLGIRDAVAALLLITGTGLVLARTSSTSTHSAASASVPGGVPGGDVQVLAGRAFGTTWTVKLRPPVADPVALEAVLGGELERIEASLSHWRTNSATSQFNAASTTQALEMPGELVSLVARCQEISRATDGAFDITVAPLVRAWGFGPGESPPSPPDAAALEILRARVGWQRLGIDTNAMTLRKDHPGLQIDLGAILQGYAADRLSERLVAAGSTNHLIEVGGELLARGRWGVAIEEPGGAGRVLRRVTLQDAALATSGTYRTRRSDGGRARSHLIDPRTALPVDQGVVLASVVHRSCALADAWATAMLVLGGTNAEAFVRTAGIEVLTVEGLRQPWQVGTTRGFPAETPVE
jgi:thiamine biosynthesis lipoprotein